jgi:hypothetical protein
LVVLCVRRSLLTRILGDLQRCGLIRIGHGRLILPDRNAAEQACCECRAHMRDRFRTRPGEASRSTQEGDGPSGIPSLPLSKPGAGPAAVLRDERVWRRRGL